MSEIKVFPIIIFSLLLWLTYYRLLRNTVFGVNFARGNYTGFFVFFDLTIHIIPSIILLNTIPIERFWVAFNVKQNSIFWISCLILATVLVFYLTLYLLTRFDKKHYYFSPLFTSNNIIIRRFTRISIIICFCQIIIAWMLYDFNHSFTQSIISGANVSAYRLEIAANKSLKAMKHLFIFIAPFLTTIIASPVYEQKKVERYILLFSILFIASWGGSKGPLATIFIVYFISIITFKQVNLKVSLIAKTFLFVIVLLFLVYRIVLFQYPHLKESSLFFDYFSQRVFVAQIIGVYEQFNLLIRDSNYFWHGVPFASFFIDFPVFHKDLMLISENRLDPSGIGIKNTLFIAEAYGMGGLSLLILSPVWMAITFLLNYRWMLFLTNKFIFNNIEYAKRIVPLSIFSYVSVTGGFSDLMLFKITIMMTILITPFLVLNKIINMKKR